MSETRYVGEIGLDGRKEYAAHLRMQIDVFDQILTKCESAGGKILSIHSRHAAGKVLDSLERFSNSGTPVLHWFSGSKSELNRAIKMGCWFSIGAPMTKTKKGIEIIKSIPLDRMLTETDAPFAGGENVVHSLKISIDGLSTIRERSPAQIDSQLKRNLNNRLLN